jgi:hypothetical protein
MEEYDYYKIAITKKSYTDVYIRVPRGEVVSFHHRKLIKEATLKTITKYDWDDFGWENDLDVDGLSKVSEKEATEYVYYDAHDFKN